MYTLRSFKVTLLASILMLTGLIIFVTGNLHGFQTQEATAAIHYVTIDGNCGSMSPCYSNIQNAVDAASDGDEIRVAGGTYTGVSNVAILNSANFTATQIVAVTKSITLRGGYSIAGWESSDPAANETILDAEWQGRVMIIMGEVTPIVEGFTMRNGDATRLGGRLRYDDLCIPSNYPVDGGGGLYITRANATIRNNKITSNRASTANWAGGGGIMLNCSSSTIIDNEISVNTGHSSGRGKGGGVFAGGTGRTSDVVIRPIITNNQILYNVAGNDSSEGGGIYIGEGIAIVITDNLILGNEAALTATGSGGGIHAQLTYNQPTMISRNTIQLNRASQTGGSGAGITLLYVGEFTIRNNIIADNYGVSSIRIYGLDPHTLDGYLIHNTVTTYHANTIAVSVVSDTVLGSNLNVGTISFVNNIFANHTGIFNVWARNNTTVTVNAEHTLWDGNGTYITTYGTGEIVNTSNDIIGNPALIPGSYRLTSSSDAIDAGLDTGLNHDIDGDLRPIGMGVDIGADEHYIEATVSADGAVIDGRDAQGYGLMATIPAGAVDEETVFILTPRAQVSQQHSTLSFGGRVFDFYATRNDSPIPDFTFLAPVTLTITYADSDIVGIAEDTLEILYWDGTAWVDDGIVFVSRNTVDNNLTVTIDHLSEFAMFGTSYRLYLPVVVR